MPRQLTPEQEELLDEIIATREYDDPNQAIIEVFQDAIDSDRELAELRAALQIGIDQRARGEFVEYTAEWRAERLRQVLEQTEHSRATA
jgi:hypothetical protein